MLEQIDFESLEKVTLKDKFVGGTIGDIVSALIPYIFATAGILLLLYLIYGGYQFMFSRGDPKAVQQAKGVMTTALIGFVIVFVAFWLVQIIGRLLGFIWVPFG